MTGWQPIETAPKDGTNVDLWVNGKRLANCFWIAGWRQRYAENPVSSFSLTERESEEATHWMPLPEPPMALGCD